MPEPVTREPRASLPLRLGVAPAEPRAEPAWPPVNTPAGLAGRVAIPGQLLPGFSTNLFVQGYLDQAEPVGLLAAHTGVGAVLTLKHGRRKASVLQRVRQGVGFLQQAGAAADVLIDCNHYSGGGPRKKHLFGEGSRRKTAADGLTAGWIADQHRILGLRWALTDSGYCDSLADTARVLADAARFGGDLLTLLPLPYTLLRDDASGLLDQINAQPHPVAVVLEHEQDPFDEEGVVAGAVHLLQRVDRPLLFLRCDTSALGLISHGAAVGAVGTESGLRHLFPVTDDDSPIPRRLAFVIPDLLGYYTEGKFAPAFFADPGLAAWRCPCWFCAGRDLSWIAGEPDKLREIAAFQHSVAAVAELGGRLSRDSATVGAMAAWDLMCGLAQAEHSLVSNPAGNPWQPKRALKHWRRVTPRSTVS